MGPGDCPELVLMATMKRLARPEKWFQDATTPLFVLDHRRAVLAFNQGCQDLTGWQLDDLAGGRAVIASTPDAHSVEALLSALAPPPEVYEGKAASQAIFLPHRKHAARPQILAWFPMHPGSAAPPTLPNTAPTTPIKTTHVLGLLSDLPTPVPVAKPSLAQELHAELGSLRAQLRRHYQISNTIGRSPGIEKALRQVQLAAAATLPAILIGDIGTGRNHFARLIHGQSAEQKQAFIPLDCHLLSEHELAGTIERVFEQFTPKLASTLSPGCLYLNQVGSLTPSLQEQLLRWSRTKPLRVIASCLPWAPGTDRPAGLNAELWGWLSAIAIHLPPVRDRGDDLPLLAQYFLEEQNRLGGRQLAGFHAEVLEEFVRYRWPGNVRELQAVVTELHATAAPPLATVAALPFTFRTAKNAQRERIIPLPELQPLDALLTQTERQHLLAALARSRNNITKAAELLGISRARLYRRLEQLELLPNTPE